MKTFFASLWEVINRFIQYLLHLIFGKPMPNNPSKRLELVCDFPSACFGNSNAQLIARRIDDENVEFKIEGRPQITDIYKKFNVSLLKEETLLQRYNPDGTTQDEKFINEDREHDMPFERAELIVIWYYFDGVKRQVFTTAIGESITLKFVEYQEGDDFMYCVRPRVYILSGLREHDSGEPGGDDPPAIMGRDL